MRLSVVVVAVVVVVGSAACETGGASSPASGPARVDDAIARTEAVGTGRYVVSIVAGGGERPLSLRATGAFDRPLGAVTMTTDLSVFAPDLGGAVTVVASPNGLFVDCPSLARRLRVSTRWISVRGQAAQALRSSVLDPWRVLDLVRTSRTPSGDGVEVVLGDDGLVHRAAVRFDAAATGDVAWLSVEFFDLGAPVDIGSPAPDETTDETDALNRLMGGSTGG